MVFSMNWEASLAWSDQKEEEYPMTRIPPFVDDVGRMSATIEDGVSHHSLTAKLKCKFQDGTYRSQFKKREQRRKTVGRRGKKWEFEERGNETDIYK